jgi:hypothetical protein
LNTQTLSLSLDPWSTQCFSEVIFTPEKYSKKRPLDIEIDAIDNQPLSNEKIMTKELFKKSFVNRTLDECRQEAKAPQRSKKWHDARRYCITASSFGSAVGNNPYCSPKNAMIEKIWASFVESESTMYGTFHEKDAQDSFIKALNSTTWLSDLYKDYTSFCFLEVGLLKSYKDPWIAVSPDGLLVVNGPQGIKVFLIEFKCPASQRDSPLHPYRKYKYNVPQYYMDQIQGIMGLLNKYPELTKEILIDNQHLEALSFIKDYNVNDLVINVLESMFVVWQPKQMHATRVPYQPEYFNLVLEPGLKAWHEEFIAFSVLKASGQLVKNSLETILIF